MENINEQIKWLVTAIIDRAWYESYESLLWRFISVFMFYFCRQSYFSNIHFIFEYTCYCTLFVTSCRVLFPLFIFVINTSFREPRIFIFEYMFYLFFVICYWMLSPLYLQLKFVFSFSLTVPVFFHWCVCLVNFSGLLYLLIQALINTFVLTMNVSEDVGHVKHGCQSHSLGIGMPQHYTHTQSMVFISWHHTIQCF